MRSSPHAERAFATCQYGLRRYWKCWRTGPSLLFLEFPDRRPFVHGQMVGSVALDQVLRLALRGMDCVSLERNRRRDPFQDRSPNMTGFRVPSDVISDLKVVLHLRD